MDIFAIEQAGFWLALGFVLLAIELVAFGLGSGVLLFGSVGALITGALLWFGIVPNDSIASIACFAISTAAATALLWIPFKKLQSGAELGNDRSSDIIGHQFLLSSDISQQVHGQQKYSGIQWRVEPARGLKNPTIKAGTEVSVVAVQVGAFFVEPVSNKIN